MIGTLGRTGLYVMTKGVRFEWLFCGCGFKVSWHGMARTRLIFFFRKWQLYPRSSGKFISSLQRYWRNRQLSRCDADAVRRGWNRWCASCGQDGRRFSEDIGACLWVQFVWRSVSIWLLLRWTCASRKGRLWYKESEYYCVNLIAGWTECTWCRKFLKKFIRLVKLLSDLMM